MKNPKFSLLNDFKKLSWDKQKKIILIVFGSFMLILLVVILSFCASGEKEEPASGEPEDIIAEEAEAPDIYYVTAFDNNRVNVRKEPSVDSDRVLTIPAGDTSVRLLYLRESVYAEQYFWHKVLLPDGGSGWVREDVVVVDVSDEASGEEAGDE